MRPRVDYREKLCVSEQQLGLAKSRQTRNSAGLTCRKGLGTALLSQVCLTAGRQPPFVSAQHVPARPGQRFATLESLQPVALGDQKF